MKKNKEIKKRRKLKEKGKVRKENKRDKIKEFVLCHTTVTWQGIFKA